LSAEAEEVEACDLSVASVGTFWEVMAEVVIPSSFERDAVSFISFRVFVDDGNGDSASWSEESLVEAVSCPVGEVSCGGL
jgi:hypothetical protein